MEINFPILVINLDSAQDRWKSCIQQAENYGLNLTRIPAVTPNKLPFNSTHYVADGVRAVWQSHLECFRFLESTGARYALILEDDFWILNAKKLGNYLNNPKVLEYDLVQFGFLKPGIDTRVKVFIANVETRVFKLLSFLSQFPIISSSNFPQRLRVRESKDLPQGFTADDFQPGAHCYLISRDLARVVPELNNPQFLSIDDFFTAFSQMRSYKFIRVRRSLVDQAPFAKWQGDRFLT